MAHETIMAVIGEEFKVELESSPGTGYVWSLQVLPKGLRLLGRGSEKLADGARPGDSVRQIFGFKALEQGDYSLVFLLKRPWETDTTGSRTITVKVN